jgi:hypothetical protein
MSRPPVRAEGVLRATLLVLALGCAAALHAQAPTPLKTIEPAGGGHIVYGQVDGESSESGAMGAILRSLHRQYADKPQVGKVFQVKDSNSAAVFFTLTKRNQGNAPIAGLIIARRTGPASVEAALLSDEAARFGTTINPMLKTLFGVWHPVTQSPAAAAVSAPPASLNTYTLPDHTAAVGLPAGWKVEPSSGGGTILADGPHGEAVSLDFPFLAMNSSDPRVQQTMRFAQGAGRNTSYAHALYYPYGADPGKTFADLLQMRRRMMGLGPVTMQLEGETALPAQGARCAQLRGRLDDPADGKGMREFNTVFCSGALSPMGQYMNLAWHTAVPLAFADRERATMGAILASFQVNVGLVSQQAAAIAAPAIEHIHAIGRAAAAQAQQAHALSDLHNQSVEARWDSQDRHNQAFSNYLLDQTVISDSQNNAHATVWNQTADAMVRTNPQRFGYVDTPDFWKGVDY